MKHQIDVIDLAMKMTAKRYTTPRAMIENILEARNLTIEYAFKITKWLDAHQKQVEYMMSGTENEQLSYYYKMKFKRKKVC